MLMESAGRRQVRLISRGTRGRVRAGTSFLVGILSTRTANLLCMTIVKAMTYSFPKALVFCCLQQQQQQKSSALGKPDVSQQAAVIHWPLADDVDIYL